MKKVSLLVVAFALIASVAQAQDETVNGHLKVNTSDPNTLRLENDVAGQEATIRFRSKPSSGSGWLHGDIGLYATGSNIGFLGFKVPHNNSYGIGYKMIINNDGHVGIGTISPEMKLDIEGSISLRGETSPVSGNAMVLGWSTTGDFSRIRSRDWSAAQWKRLDFQASEYTFREGNVGFGTATSFDGLNNQGIHVDKGGHSTILIGDGINDGGVIQSSDNSRRVFIGSNLYDDPNLSWKNFTTGKSAAVDIIGNSGKIRFITSSSGGGYNSSLIRMSILDNGNIGIGTEVTGSHKLAVEGSIGAREIKVEASGWSDFVFEDNYELRTLEETEDFISKNKHLPEIPSEAEVIENGINLGEMDAKLLQKIEELTLYMIEMNKRVNQLETENTQLKEKVQSLESE